MQPDSVTDALGPDDRLSGRRYRCSKPGRPARRTLLTNLPDSSPASPDYVYRAPRVLPMLPD
jgi:hypothetical protein